MTCMPTLEDSECDITDSASATVSPSIREDVVVPERVSADQLPTMSHVSVKIEAQPARAPLDIEHVLVQDDPREWSQGRKKFTLALISSAALIGTLGINSYNPAINDIKSQLHANDQEISLTLSLSILVQGTIPLFWSALSEIRGRKFVYLISITIYVAASGVAGSARSIGVLIAMRILQAVGASAVLTIGATTLADIYEPRERGTVVGIFYVAPLLGPSLGPLIGGVLTQLLSWRSTFYFVAIFAGVSLLSLLFFRDTFRRERSLLYQNALQRHRHADEKRGDMEEKNDLESAVRPPPLSIATMRPTLRDVNPITPLWDVLRRRNNLAVFFSTAMLYGIAFSITYTAVRTFAAAPYGYGALDIGLVLLSFGIGSMMGSILGGRWSDHVMARLKATNGGDSRSEDRLQSTKLMMPVLPLSVLAYAWMAEKKVHIAGICVVLFIVGASSIWMYSSTLAYIVDANAGRSSTAVACNSFVRGFTAFVAGEVAVPLQDALGDGGLYTLWAALMVLSAGTLVLTMARGARWREQEEAREWERREAGKA